jgi:outer membrane murein-binding lipoprotein Lpp
MENSMNKCLIAFVGISVVIMLLSGCISQKGYTELVKRNELLTQEKEATQTELNLLKDSNATAMELDRLKKGNTRLQEEIESLAKQVKALTEPKLKPAGVVVIAPSVSTSMEARSILSKQGWTETSLRNASAALAVVRSMLSNPLSSSYENYYELKQDAEGQLNISGENFHIYTFSLDDDLRAVQLKHISYKVQDF